MITTGGTGGHVFPGLAVADKLAARGADVFWLGTREGMEATLVPKHGIAFESVSFRGVRGKGVRTLVLGPFALVAASLEARAVIKRRDPGVVLGLGGFASFPGALMAVATGRPLVVHDANAVAGLANRVLAHGADRILLGFPEAMRGKHAKLVEWTGNPLRAEMTRVAPPQHRFADRRGPLRLLVVGGSLGAQGLNERVPAAVARLSPVQRPHVLHQAGAKHIDALKAAYRDAGVEAECVAFIDDMAERYAWADFAIARGGAITVSELAAVGLGALIVPLPGAIADEQTANADLLVNAKAAFRLPQDELTVDALAALLGRIDRPMALDLAIAARSVGKIDAAERVADVCLGLAESRR
ncbi:MAG: undecaprenyldiphospho-muramoylpentapeptide beta-N-acetylglucosaminyltransferase [Vicinamibacteria bacterium]|jgi:UDP-N-acetylglucosamine--N-acetylmuramyl-(pentapeptide) pyrophosphoryl-undecaprenol N-acetylglucosamine transferase